MRSEIHDPRNHNSVESNLTQGETNALKQLQRMQRERQIVIRACDKGAGVIILDFNEYLRACYLHLTSEVKPGQPYYSPVDEFEIERAKKKLRQSFKRVWIETSLQKQRLMK